MGDGVTMTTIYLREIELRGADVVRARVVSVIAGLCSGIATMAHQGRPLSDLDVRVLAGAWIALQQADLVPASMVVTHLRLALGCLTLRQNGAPVPARADLLMRWIEACKLRATVEPEIGRQQTALRAAVEAAGGVASVN